MVGLVEGGGRGLAIHIEGPPATQQYKREFGVSPDGGYEVTALTSWPPDSVYYTLWLVGPNVRSGKYLLRYEDGARTRAVIDWKRGACP